MREPLLGLSATLMLSLLAAGQVRAQGMPGATVGLPLGSPDPFGLSTVNRPADAEAARSAAPSAERGVDSAGRRAVRPPLRRLKGQRDAAPKQRTPAARR